MAKGDSQNERISESYDDTGVERSIQHTMGNAAVVSVITLPDDAKGFKLKPVTTAIRFSVYTDTTRTPVAIAATSGTTVAASEFVVGGIALADVFETRLLPALTNANTRKLALIGTVNAQVCDVEIF